jgi:hypothetical protein
MRALTTVLVALVVVALLELVPVLVKYSRLGSLAGIRRRRPPLLRITRQDVQRANLVDHVDVGVAVGA